MTSATFAHVGMVCKDPIRLEKFYTKHFGFTRARVFAPGPDQVVIIRSENLALELFKATAERPDKAPARCIPAGAMSALSLMILRQSSRNWAMK
jgi:hypothetical protein